MTQTLSEAVRLCNAGYAVHYLCRRSKQPISDGWASAPVKTIDQLKSEFKPSNNLGYRAGHPSIVDGKAVVVVDIDVRDPQFKKAAWAAVKELLGNNISPTVRTGGGGAHIYFSCPQERTPDKAATTLRASNEMIGKRHAWQVELLSTGKNITCPPSIHPDTGKPYEWVGDPTALQEAPENLLVEVEKILNQQPTWEEPILFGKVVTPEIPSNLFPSWLGEYIDAVAQNTQTPSSMVAMTGLAAVATCLQKRFVVSPYGDDYSEPLSLWTVTGLPPASRKTAVIQAMTEPLNEWEREAGVRMAPTIAEREAKRAVILKRIERLQGEAAKEDNSVERDILIREIADLKRELPEEIKPPRLWTSDVTPERIQNMLVEQGERMAVLADEGGIFEIMSGLYSDGKVNMDVFLQAHAGKSVRVDRGSRTVILHKPALTFGLLVQPEIIADLSHGSKRRLRGNGGLARFLYCMPKSNVGSRDVTKRAAIPETVKTAYHNGIENLLKIPAQLDEHGVEQARVLRLDREARNAWLFFSQYIEVNQGERKEFEPIQDWTGKLPGAALRIAGQFHVVEHGTEDMVIKLPTVEKALDLCQLLIKHAQAAFDMMGADPASADAQHVLRWILAEGKKTFTQHECHRAHHGRFIKVDRLIKALDILIDRHIIDGPHEDRAGKRRPSIWYAVNPALLKGGV